MVIRERVILEKFSPDSISKAFVELEAIVPSLDLDSVEIEGEDKYLDREYAYRKFGL